MQVKTESFMEAIKARGLSDLWSSLRAGKRCEGVLKKRERPVGVPAAHGHGVMEVHMPGGFGWPPNT
jgi:hypothetical protein